MIFLVGSPSRFCVASIVFYTCVWIPLVQLKKALGRALGIISFFFFAYKQPEDEGFGAVQPCLPVARYVDLQSYNSRGKTKGKVEESCSVCLVEFEKEDLVSQLSKCGHVFHMECIEKWLDCHHFTCPLCRSSFFSTSNASQLLKPLDLASDLDPYTPSYLGFSWH
ncbi:hypothetical protein UlMin_032032 [Ulmus minor]